jgi:TPR repeat protein
LKAAAEQDHVFACLYLGEFLLDDKDPEHNTDRGIYWLSRAGELGNRFGFRTLGDLYLLGHRGRPATSERSTKFPQLIEPDKVVALSWYERQIELERREGSFFGTHSLARLYLLGDHLDQDPTRAEQLLLEAGNNGHLDSQRLLAREYISGKVLQRNANSALYWLKKAEENIESQKRICQYELGYFYEFENDDSPNYAEAMKWYLKAADHGDYRSQKNLGAIYESGKGMSRDYVQAYKWYLLSAASSFGKPGRKEFYNEAIKTRDALAQKMTPPQLAEAHQLASDWLNNNTSIYSPDYECIKEWLAQSAS